MLTKDSLQLKIRPTASKLIPLIAYLIICLVVLMWLLKEYIEKAFSMHGQGYINGDLIAIPVLGFAFFFMLPDATIRISVDSEKITYRDCYTKQRAIRFDQIDRASVGTLKGATSLALFPRDDLQLKPIRIPCYMLSKTDWRLLHNKEDGSGLFDRALDKNSDQKQS